MAKEKICGIYCIENLVNGKKYIGSSINIKNRWYSHKTSLKKGLHHSYKLQRAWNKYGEENFEFKILKEIEIDQIKELRKIEQNYLDKFQSYNFKFGYNVNQNSNGGNKNFATELDLVEGKYKISKEQMDEIIYYLSKTSISIPKISKITGVHDRSIYQIYFRENYKEITKDIIFQKRNLYGENSYNAKLTEEIVLKIIELYQNRISQIEISKILKINVKTINDILQKKTWTYLTKDIVFEHFKKSNPKKKLVIQYDLNNKYINTYESAREAEKQTGIGFKMISRVCNGKRPYTHGFIFKFAQ